MSQCRAASAEEIANVLRSRLPEARQSPRADFYAALTLAICISRREAAAIARQLEAAPDELRKAPIREGLKIFGSEIERLEKKRAELEEQFENRTGGS